MKANVINILTFSMVLALILCGCKEEAKSSEQSVNPRKEKCEDQNIIIEMEGGGALAIPRTANIQTKEREYLGLERQCDIKRISDVRQARWSQPDAVKALNGRLNGGQTYFQVDFLNKPQQSAYSKYKSVIDKAELENKVENLGNGLRRVDQKNSEVYILPVNQGSGKSKEPVIIYCNGSSRDQLLYLQSCQAAFTHLKKFNVLYRFSRTNKSSSYLNSPDKFIDIDRENRNYIDELTLLSPSGEIQ